MRTRGRAPVKMEGQKLVGEHRLTAPWHTPKCLFDPRTAYERPNATPPFRAFFCLTHGQWMYEKPVSVEYTWTDGSKITKVIE
jgi:hypothetical protein